MKAIAKKIPEYLKRVDVLKDLSREDISLLLKQVQPFEYPPGALLFAPDDPAERLFLLKVGQVDLYRLTAAGKKLAVRRLGPGTIFGEMALLGQSLQECFAEAAEHCMVCVVTRESILEVLRQHPDVAIRLLEVIGERLRLSEERLEAALFSPVKVRLASFLLASMEPVSGVVSDYTHEDIGDTIGALRQTVTETLSLMRDRGLVEVERKQIRVVDREKLVEMARGEEAVLLGGERGYLR